MKIYDITLPMGPDMVRYPGDPKFTITPFKETAKGDSANVSIYRMGSHTGTHIDSGHHILANGRTADKIPAEKLVARARVFDLCGASVLDKAVLSALDFGRMTHVLFKTDNSADLRDSNHFNEKFVHFDATGADFLARQGIALAGIDYLSVDRFHSGDHPAHHHFLEAGVIILEGVDLFKVPAGDYTLFVGMLKIEHADGAPARVLLIKDI